MSTLIRLRSLFVPITIGVIIVAGLGYYSLFWLPSQQRCLDDRNFRVLKTLSEQVRLSVNNFDKMMDNAADAGIKSENLGGYLRNVAPQLEKPEDNESKPVIGGDYGDPPKIAVAADEGTHFLYLAFKREKVQYAVRTDLDKLIRGLLPPNNRNPFDVVLVAQNNGRVIFQQSSPGIDVARIDTLADASGTTKTGKPDPIEVESLSQSSRLEEIKLAGARYRLYSQPLQLSFATIVPGVKSAKGNATADLPERWVLCGLTRADRFRSESQSISYTYMLWFSAAILLAMAAYPFLKLHLSGPAERLRAGDLVVAAIVSCAVAAALTFILLDLDYWHEFGGLAENQMKKLAEAIDSNFGNEKDRAFAQLQDFEDKHALPPNLSKIHPHDRPPRVTDDAKECKPSWACRTRILSDRVVPLLKSYPYLQHVSWSDSDGHQRVKWTIKERLTPFINLDDLSIPYYPDIKRAIRNPGGLDVGLTQGIGSQYSSNTGENITVFWKLMDIDGNAVSGKLDAEHAKKVFCASLVTFPISVVGPVVPGGFQFAIIKPDGTVVFHSDPTRNLRENFFDETNQNQEVRSRVLMRAAGPLVAKYMGRPYRLYIRPMQANQDALWTVVVFRDLRLEETMNLEMISLASIIFFLYAGVIALALAVAHWTRGGRPTGSWLWPDSGKAGTYRRLVIINSTAALLLFVVPQFLSPVALLFSGILIPVGAMVFNLVALRRQADQSSSEDVKDETTSSPWQLGYIGACTTLLAVVAVLPCLSFFKVAGEFEHKLFIEQNQLHIANDFAERREHIRAQYQGIDLGKPVTKDLLADPEDQHAARLLAEPEDQHAARLLAEPGDKKVPAPVFSYHEILDETETAQDPDNAPKSSPVQCGFGAPGSPQRCLELFLSWVSPLYDQFAADGRYLAEAGSSDIWTWSPTSPGSEEKLKLTRREPGEKVRTIVSSWTPLYVPWHDWRWWAGTVAFMAALCWLVRISLRSAFLLDLPEAERTKSPEPPSYRKSHDIPSDEESPIPPIRPLDPTTLIAKLPMNLVIIGPVFSPTIKNLIGRKKRVQAYHIDQLMQVSIPMAKAVGGGSIPINPSWDPFGAIVQDGRPVVLYGFEPGSDDSKLNQQRLAALEKVLSRVNSSVAITCNVDMKSAGGEREQWRTLLRSFVRIDLNERPVQRMNETLKEFEGRISAAAYYRRLFSDRPRPQRLVLIHLAQEKVVNPSSRRTVCDLMSEGLIARPYGMLTIKDDHFADFLKCAVLADKVKEWERQGAGPHSATLRTSLLVAGLGLAGFLFYTQGEPFNTWVTYMTGLAASGPAALRLLKLFRPGSGAEA